MNKLKEKDGKYYQEVEVVMLATNEKAQFYLDRVIGLTNAPQDRTIKGLEYQHLYLLSSEKIKDERILYCNLEKQIIDYRDQPASPKSILGYSYMDYCKKIIATTDTSLGLPQPSQSFIQAYIKAYNEGKPITKVLVEYEKIHVGWEPDYTFEDEGIDGSKEVYQYFLKINSSNEITIKKIKDSYTRKEVTELLKQCIFDQKGKIYTHDLDWIEENL